jgi:hypothetical protein
MDGVTATISLDLRRLVRLVSKRIANHFVVGIKDVKPSFIDHFISP